jgi:hypothetical protein
VSTGLYSHTTRSTGTVLTAAIYNADHTNHITNQNPSQTGAYSDNVAQMQSATDPGESGSESLASSLAGEIERLRFAIQDIKSFLGLTSAQWYSTPTGSIVSKTLTNPTITNPVLTSQALTDAAPTTWDMNSGQVATWTMGASRTISAPTNLKAGGRYVLRITMDSTGGRLVTWNAVFKGDGGNAMPQPSQQANAITQFTFTSDGTNLYLESHEALVLLATGTASSSSSLDFTNLNSGFAGYLFELDSVLPATNAADLNVRVSEDNGATFKSGGSDYEYSQISVDTGATSGVGASAAATGIACFAGTNNNSSHSIGGFVKATNLSSSSKSKNFNWSLWGLTSGGPFASRAGGGGYVGTVNAVNGVRFIFSSGNIASGVIRCYGIRG